MANERLLLNDIRDYVGKDGRIPFEHGYRPVLNATEVRYEGVVLRVPGPHGQIWLYESMDEDQLKNVICELFRYRNFCELYA